MKRKVSVALILAIALVAVAALTGVSGFYRVGQGEEALVLTFGRVTDHKGPGLLWYCPLIQEVKAESVTTIHTMEYGFRTTQTGGTTVGAQYADNTDEGVMLTGDNSIVQVEAIYQYTISDVKEYLYDVDDPLTTMHLAFEAVLRRNIQSRPLDDALLNKEEIERQVLPDFQRMIDSYKMGVTIRGVRIQNISVPADVTAAYEDVNNAKNEKTRKLDEAERYQNEVLPAARSRAYQTLQEAESYRADQAAKATAEVSVFKSIYEKYRLAPQVTKDRLTIETLERVLSGVDRKFIVSGEDGTLKLLPLDGEEGGKGL